MMKEFKKQGEMKCFTFGWPGPQIKARRGFEVVKDTKLFSHRSDNEKSEENLSPRDPREEEMDLALEGLKEQFKLTDVVKADKMRFIQGKKNNEVDDGS
jgi:hypothetical protein